MFPKSLKITYLICFIYFLRDSLELKQMDQGNKLAVLLGDYLLASACKNLAKLHNNEVKRALPKKILLQAYFLTLK